MEISVSGPKIDKLFDMLSKARALRPDLTSFSFSDAEHLPQRNFRSLPMERREFLKILPLSAIAPKIVKDSQPPFSAPAIGQIPADATDDPFLGAPICAVFSHNGYCGVRFYGKSVGSKSTYEGDAKETIEHLKHVIKMVEQGFFGFQENSDV